MGCQYPGVRSPDPAEFPALGRDTLRHLYTSFMRVSMAMFAARRSISFKSRVDALNEMVTAGW